MRKSLLYLAALCLLLSVIVFHSCKRDLPEKDEVQASSVTELTVKSARTYFYTDLKQQKEKPGSDVSKINSLRPYPVWDKAISYQGKNLQMVEVPAYFKSAMKFTISLKNPSTGKALASNATSMFERMLIFKDAKGKMHQRIVTYIPDPAYAARHQNDVSHNYLNKLDKDFTGYLLYSTPTRKKLFALWLENGKSKKKINFESAKNGGAKNPENGRTSGWDFIEFCIDQWITLCDPIDCPPDTAPDPTTNECLRAFRTTQACHEEYLGQDCEIFWYYVEDTYQDPCDDPINANDPDCNPNYDDGDDTICYDCDNNSNGNPYSELIIQLNGILAPGDSYSFDSNLDPNQSLSFTTVADFQNYLSTNASNQQADLSPSPTIIDANTKVEHAKFNLTFIGGIDVSVKLTQSGTTWSVDNVTSTDYGVTIGWSWDQSTFSQTTSGNEITILAEGYVKYNIIVEGIGTVYKQFYKFRIKVNNQTGQITSLAKL